MKTITSRPEGWTTIDPILEAELLNAHARIAELEEQQKELNIFFAYYLIAVREQRNVAIPVAPSISHLVADMNSITDAYHSKHKAGTV